MTVLEKSTKRIYTKQELRQLARPELVIEPIKNTLADILINAGGSGIGGYEAVATVPTEPGNLNNTYWVMYNHLNPGNDLEDQLYVGDGTHPDDGIYDITGIIRRHDWGNSAPLHDNGLIAIEESPTFQWLNSHFAPAYLNLRAALAIWGFLAVYNTIRAILNKNPYTKRARWVIAGTSIGGAVASGVSYWYLFKGSKDIAKTVTGKHYENFDKAWGAVYNMLKTKMVPFWDRMAMIGNILKYAGYAFSVIAPIALYLHTRRIEKKIEREIGLKPQ